MYNNSKVAKAIRLAIMVSAGAAAISAPAFSAEEVEEDKVEQVERIEVTGSRIRRIDMEATQPMTVIDGDYISNRGLTNAITAVTDQPGIFTGTGPIIADNEEANSQGLGQNTIDIYGLGAQRTLTLVNGSRFISSNSPEGSDSAGSQIDVNNIPVALIDRVEVVKVGGAPVYGADAVSGVVNYILKKDYEGAEFSYDYRDLDGFGQEDSFKALIGGNFNNGKGNLVVSVEYNKTDHIPMNEVPYLSNDWSSQSPVDADQVADPDGNVPGNQSRLYPDPRAGLLSFSGLATPGDTALTNLGVGAFADGNFYQFSPTGSGDLVQFDTGTPLNSAVWSSGGDGLDLTRTNTAQEGYERFNLSVIGNYDLTDDINLSITAFANASDAANPGYQAANYNSGIWNGSDGGALVFNTDHPYLNDQARGLLEAEAEIGPSGDFYYHRGWINLGAREIVNESSVRSLKADLQGDFTLADRDFTWAVSFQKGVSSVYSESSGLSDARFWAAMDVGVNPGTGELDCKFNYEDGYGENLRSSGFGLEDSELVLGNVGDCAPLNPFGTASEASKNYVMFNTLARSRLEQDLFNAYISGPIVDLPAGELQFALGYERRTEQADYTADGTEVLTGFTASNIKGEYTTEDIFGELYVPIISQDMDIPLLHTLEAEMSYRSMDNTSAGKDDAWAVGINYRPIADLAIKANISETVRAPAISELFQPLLQRNSFASDPCDELYREDGPNPAVRQANCDAEGIPADFKSDAAIASRGGYEGGNDSLKNERAESVSFGIFYSPSWFEGFSVGFDWVDISMIDAIVSFSLEDIMEACYDGTDYPNKFCNQFSRGADHQVPVNDAFQSGFVNAAFRDFEAIEYSVTYGQELSKYPLIGGLFPENAGELSINFYAFNLKEDSLSNTGFDFTDETGQYDSPEWRSTLTITHTIDDLTTYVGMRYLGEGVRNIESDDPYRYIDENGNPYSKIESQTIWDLGAQYNFSDSLTFRVRVENLADWRADAKEVSVARFAWGRTINLGVTARF